MDWLGITLPDLLMFAAIGFAAQLVDGALGMAFGVITNTLLVGLMGLPPAQASQRVHVVECFTTAISGISHLLHRNIDGKLFLRLLIPGVLGGVTGAYLISNIDAEVVRPLVMIYLAAIGVFLLLRGIFYPPKLREARLVAPLGLIGGFLDAAGGGGWGPVVTSNLLIQGTEPRKVIGTVNAVEFFLTLSISATFITQIGLADLVGPTLGLLIGGMAAAPFGAWFARRLPVKAMLILVGTVLSATSAYAVWTAWS
jgi:uncharacterized membrane protein YfcA